MLFNFSNLKNFDWSLLLVATLLVLIGLSVIYSITLSQPEPDYSLLYKQIIFFGTGLIFLFFFSFIDYRILGSVAPIFYIASILVLISLLFFGTTIRGTTGWFVIFGVSIQPVELAKLVMVIFLAKFLSTKVSEKFFFRYVIYSLILVLIPSLLVILQPDLGSALVLFLLWLVLIWFSGLDKKHLFYMFLISAVIFALGWLFFFQDYQKDRMINFIDPSRDPLGAGYNVKQSVIAIGSGGLLGRGLGLGPQSQLNFLPETEADFIFASLSEELGFMGAFLVLFLYFLLFFKIYKIVKITRDNFSSLLVLGIAIIFLVQIIINIGMSLALLPVTGLPLPFISSGGSFLIVSMILIGILESVVIRNKGVV